MSQLDTARAEPAPAAALASEVTTALVGLPALSLLSVACKQTGKHRP